MADERPLRVALLRDPPSRKRTPYASGLETVWTNAYTSVVEIAGFDWDDGNWPKCGKHGVSRAEIEQVLLGEPAVMADPFPGEPRMRAIGRTAAGRYVFLVFMLRKVAGRARLRPISARYMHQTEVEHYEDQG